MLVPMLPLPNQTESSEHSLLPFLGLDAVDRDGFGCGGAVLGWGVVGGVEVAEVEARQGRAVEGKGKAGQGRGGSNERCLGGPVGTIQ